MWGGTRKRRRARSERELGWGAEGWCAGAVQVRICAGVNRVAKWRVGRRWSDRRPMPSIAENTCERAGDARCEARASAEGGTLGREELVRLGRAGNPWGFLPKGVRAFEARRDDAELGFLVAANFARLHLKTAAAEVLGSLPESLLSQAGVASLVELVGRLPGDEIAAWTRRAICAANLETLAMRGIDLSSEFRAWDASVESARWFRAVDGNIVRRRVDEGGRIVWEGLCDAQGEARAIAARHLGDPAAKVRPHTVVGVDPPWLLKGVCASLTRNADGSIARVNVVETDAMAALDGLSVVDLMEELCQPRVRLYVGAGALEKLGGDLRARLQTGVTGPIVAVNTGAAEVSELKGMFAALEREQHSEQARLSCVVAEEYGERDRSWWAKRYADAMSGRGRKLRVLVPTCRFTAFVKHSAADIAAALVAAGCEVRTLIEPDETCTLSGIAYLRELAEWKPDLVVLINYTRAALRGIFGPIIPQRLPFVCWIQDAMPHLFREGGGAQQGEFDFLIGHQHGELFTTFGYPKERTMGCSVVASERKFHAGPVEGSLRRRHECEIAFASRHSETVDALHARLCREAGYDASLVRVLERLYPRVRAIGENPIAHFAHITFAKLAAEALVAVGHPGPQPDPKLTALIVKQYCAPLAERAARHQALHWAADAAEKNGWRLHVYGRGWESHPRFSRYFKGELDHGEELRASYQCAAVHLHSSIHFAMHQRVVECVLSGGYPMVRLNIDEVSSLFWAGIGGPLARDAEADCVDPATGDPAFTVADHPELWRMTGLRQRLGLPTESILAHSVKHRERFVRRGGLARPQDQALWLLGDSAENFFVTGEDFERNVRIAVERPELRRGTSRLAAARITPLLTYTALVRDVLELVQGSLGAERAPGMEAAA